MSNPIQGSFYEEELRIVKECLSDIENNLKKKEPGALSYLASRNANSKFINFWTYR